MVSLAIKCQEQHHLQGWCKGWRDQVRNAPRLFSRASHVSGGLLPPLTWALGLPRRVGAGEGRGEGSVLKAILLGHGASGLWGISLWKSPTGHSPHPGRKSLTLKTDTNPSWELFVVLSWFGGSAPAQP